MKQVNIQEYTEQLKTLVNIESGSYYPEGINRVADELEKWYRELGWHIERHDLGSETGNLLVISNRPAEHYDVLFIGHIDTVFPVGSVAEHPFTLEGDKAYGLGTCDMKNGDVAMYQVAKLLDPKALETLNICMIYNPDEEIGSRYSRKIVDEIASRTDYAYVMESATEGNCACISRKGSLGCTFRFHGQAAHAGYIFTRPNASAVLEMAHYIVELMALRNKEMDTSANVGVAKGGTVSNAVADYAEITFESRYWSLEEQARVKAKLESLVNGEPFVPGVTVEMVNFRCGDPWNRTPASEAHLAHIQSIADKLGIPFTEEGRGGGSDAMHIAPAGPITIDGMGPAGGGLAHNLGEFTHISPISDCVNLLCAVLEDLAQSKLQGPPTDPKQSKGC